MKELWIVGKSLHDERSEWEFIGVFDSKDLAIAACIDQAGYFIGPAKMNEILTEVEWEGLYYPYRGLAYDCGYHLHSEV